ncbi:IclR family transcriptional regulator [Pseudarthrobacter raffinosi]|uniref:IclR family transcriptional regulator n=1 Tax=Pseudarthrobacter raffinosi TaxID=2953651 RepID=UPI00208EE9A6|nr:MULTISPECIES: IclR family transcriptional regulator [unclassified Pseudarthrobacter]MCO4239357.1 IclR family transcriptional regulator [Pseudarthrobacter sp. MDT3-28]MCO4251336.1 IclR family transcriptional regulator [Pseudarthrobacter sp. MDT3-9]MCO4264820.1 IclR family transcriptional regulator [Pseudarthrobacter sp. MDT3-26]
MTTPDSIDTNGSDTNGKGDTKGASVIVNAIAVLRSFTADEPLLGVTEIANRVGLHKSTVSRILATFEQENLVERDADTRRFRLGLGLIAVAGPLLAELEERRVAYPVLRELTELTGETSALMMWEGNESICVEQIASRHQIKHTAPLGARYSDALSSSVQVFLGIQPEERVRALLRSGAITYPGLDEASLEDYLLRLKDDSRRGWAINYGESSLDEVGVAAPVYDHRGDLVAAVLIPAPRFRVSKERLQSLGESCRAAADKVTARLGGKAPGTIKRSLT